MTVVSNALLSVAISQRVRRNEQRQPLVRTPDRFQGGRDSAVARVMDVDLVCLYFVV